MIFSDFLKKILIYLPDANELIMKFGHFHFNSEWPFFWIKTKQTWKYHLAKVVDCTPTHLHPHCHIAHNTGSSELWAHIVAQY